MGSAATAGAPAAALGAPVRQAPGSGLIPAGRQADYGAMSETYELFYWPGIQGRGEFVRLALEDAGVSYEDVARKAQAEGGGVPALMKMMRGGGTEGLEPFAPPFLRAGTLVIAHTANILMYLAPRLGLVPEDERSRLHAHQLQLTVADFAAEVHDVHHPIAVSLYYEDQKAEAARRAVAFVGERIPKYLGYFERVLERNGGTQLLSDAHTYVDLSAFQMLAGLTYAFPRAMARLAPKFPRLHELRARVAARPRLAAYLASARRLPFNLHGLFRHYPELDGEPT
jgi:glutathione S-transferase